MDSADYGKQWYVLHTYSGYENKVKTNIESRVVSMGMEDNIFRVIVPEEEEVEVKDGKSKTAVHKTFPGYVLIEMIMSDQAWYIVRNTPGVTGFIGSHGAGSKPSPLLPEEIEVILKRMGVQEKVVSDIHVEVGDYVIITEGAFDGMSGKVSEVDQEKQKLKVIIEMFGRETIAELDFIQVKEDDTY
ncbi:transcription termination/antitermination protein NusG [Granulicatella seriolae]|uniref:Transcription termination/antitermination protein NusG n=1 Tax=Granulicatella seriolae TaxID=2967226 RepID=A0ABT1WP47_9LACT|nr:transcription termination/antitermination protein NusG [Granulicatella seriolae]